MIERGRERVFLSDREREREIVVFEMQKRVV